MTFLFNIIILAYGIYTIYAAIIMKKSQKLNGWFLGRDQAPIRDERGYIEFIYAKTITLGLVVIGFAAALAIHEYIHQIPQIVKGILLLFITVSVWFYASISKAKRMFW